MNSNLTSPQHSEALVYLLIIGFANIVGYLSILDIEGLKTCMIICLHYSTSSITSHSSDLEASSTCSNVAL